MIKLLQYLNLVKKRFNVILAHILFSDYLHCTILSWCFVLNFFNFTIWTLAESFKNFVSCFNLASLFLNKNRFINSELKNVLSFSDLMFNIRQINCIVHCYNLLSCNCSLVYIWLPHKLVCIISLWITTFSFLFFIIICY